MTRARDAKRARSAASGRTTPQPARASAEAVVNVTSEPDDDADNGSGDMADIQVTPLNLADVPKPFKNPAYKPPRKVKNLKQILMAERTSELPVDGVAYWTIDAPPSLLPRKNYCDVTGLEAPYRDPQTGLYFHNKDVYKFIKGFDHFTTQGYLSLRKAAAPVY